MAIPLTRLKDFIANAVLHAFNAKVDLMNTAPVPIKTGKFKLTLSGVLVDDLGGAGWNEIERITNSINPGATVVTTQTEPESTTVTQTDPEITTTVESGTDIETATDHAQRAESGSSSQRSNDTSTEQSKDTQTQRTDQDFGKEMETKNDYSE